MYQSTYSNIYIKHMNSSPYPRHAHCCSLLRTHSQSSESKADAKYKVNTPLFFQTIKLFLATWRQPCAES